LKQGSTHQAVVSVAYGETESLSYEWALLAEVERRLESDGGDFEPTPETFWCHGGGHNSFEVSVTLASPGEYRLFVTVSDRHGGAATANFPVLVETATT
jgi:hypothetical protein